jgi:hypothetical protein
MRETASGAIDFVGLFIGIAVDPALAVTEQEPPLLPADDSSLGETDLPASAREPATEGPRRIDFFHDRGYRISAIDSLFPQFPDHYH